MKAVAMLEKIRSLFQTRSKGAVIGYAVFITVVAIAVSMLMLLIFRGPEATAADYWIAVYIALVLAPPLGILGGLRNLKTYLMSQELARLLNRDRLTDVATRDYFFSRLAHDPQGYGVSLMIDIDHFKQVNDTFGHLVGDQVIMAVADVLRQTVRERDIVCRFGGEEFVIFLSEAGEAAGAHIAERIRADVEKRVTETECGDVRVTVSVGGSLKDSLEHIDEAIRRADEALYMAKTGGRNRAILDWEHSRAA